MKRIVVLISGNGTNLQAIIDACKQKKINGTVAAVFSNKTDAFGLERAREAQIPAHALTASQFADRAAFDRELMLEIDAYAPIWWYLPVICVFSVRNLSAITLAA